MFPQSYGIQGSNVPTQLWCTGFQCSHTVMFLHSYHSSTPGSLCSHSGYISRFKLIAVLSRFRYSLVCILNLFFSLRSQSLRTSAMLHSFLDTLRMIINLLVQLLPVAVHLHRLLNIYMK